MAQGLLLLRPFVGSAIAALLPSNASNLKSAQLYREPCFSTESTDSRQSADSGAGDSCGQDLSFAVPLGGCPLLLQTRPSSTPSGQLASDRPRRKRTGSRPRSSRSFTAGKPDVQRL